MLAEVREMSLREVGVRAPGSYERGRRHRPADRRRNPSVDTQQRRRDQPAQLAQQNIPQAETRRQIGHQSSLRSLMSSSEIDSSEMEQEILRLVDEGWLDGIDLNSLDTSQIDELSERIADAYRRRHRHGSRAGTAPAEQSRHSQDPSHGRPREQSRNRSSRSSASMEQLQHSAHPPVSRPRLLEAYSTGQNHQRRASSEQRRQTSPSPRSSARRIFSAGQNQAARSATDLSQRPSSSSSRARPSELSHHQGRRITGPDRRQRDQTRGENRPEIGTAHSTSTTGDASPRQGLDQREPRPSLPPRSSDPGQTVVAGSRTVSEHTQNPSAPTSLPRSSHVRPQTNSSVQDLPPLYTDPSIKCDQCGKQDIEYDLHYNCSICHEGSFNLCLKCYRLGRGCLDWYGFGYAALQRYQRKAMDLSKLKNHSPPHALVGRRYRRPSPASIRLPSSERDPKRTSENPIARLQSGTFCATCLDFANHCFWKCNSCLEGEWGFCNRCVNQGRCCTHPLSPVAHKSLTYSATPRTMDPDSTTLFAPASDHHSSASPLFLGLPHPDQYVPLTLSTSCSICEYPIPPSSTRLHCPQCNDGDFNICTNSYLKLISDGRISAENGNKGWRRCPSGHRMIIVGFEDSQAGQRRVIVEDLVGGHGLTDDGTNAEQNVMQEWSWRDGEQRHIRTVSKQVAANGLYDSESTAGREIPPSGGLGMRALALWSYWPREGAQDELMFPKGAEIREVENINGDWFVGGYAGKMGLFPGSYVRVLDAITS